MVRCTQLTKPSPTTAYKTLRGLLMTHLSLPLGATEYNLLRLHLLDHLHRRSLMKYWLFYTTRKKKYRRWNQRFIYLATTFWTHAISDSVFRLWILKKKLSRSRERERRAVFLSLKTFLWEFCALFNNFNAIFSVHIHSQIATAFDSHNSR